MIVWITLMITLLLAMVGMGLDTGQLVYSRSLGQHAVDAAALAAASGIPSGDLDKVQGRGISLNRTTSNPNGNDFTNSDKRPLRTTDITVHVYDPSNHNLAPSPIATANAARAAITMSNPLFLTPIINLLGASAPRTANVSVSAVAVSMATPTIPIAIFDTICNGTNPVPNVELRRQPEPPTGPENSCWTTYLDGSPGADDVRDLFWVSERCAGGSSGVQKGTPIRLAPGEQGSALGAAETLFETLQPGRCWIVPTIAKSSDCNQWSEVTDWAKICPTDVQKTGNPKYIKATVTCGQNLLGNNNNLCFSQKLVREPGAGM